MRIKNNSNLGVITTYVLVFGAVFLILLGGLLGFILLQLKQSNQRVGWAEAFQIAEAGTSYYRWCLNNEVEGNCLTQKDFSDLEGNPLGTFSLEISPTTFCQETSAQSINSVGWSNDFPDYQREVQVLYGRKSVAKYSYLLNDNVWAGEDREIRGDYHSNGGIRMDGENQSLVTSAKQDWLCTDSFGCDSSDCPPDCSIEGDNCRCPGVFTTTDNSHPDLFEFPVAPFDFDRITIDLAKVKDIADQWPQEYYWPPIDQIDSQGEGYHLKFLQDGSFEVWVITELQPTWGFSYEEGWHNDYFTIGEEYLLDTIPIDSSCPLIFVEDNLWVEGKVKGKVTVASANLVDPNQETEVILPGDLDYTTSEGSDGLTVIGEKNVLISPDSPNEMEIKGIFVAQKGRFGRNLYWANIKEKLEIYGSIISNGRVGTKWSSGSWIVSGYRKRETYVDPNLLYLPPPYTPFVSTDFEIGRWQEIE